MIKDPQRVGADGGDQGELHFEPIRQLPSSGLKEKTFAGDIIVSHSESGHHHSFAKNEGVRYFESKNPFVAYLSVAGDQEVMLEHHRSYDTHGTWIFGPGLYELTRAREYVCASENRAVED